MKVNSMSLIAARPELAELIKNLKVGDSVKGRLLEFLDGNITIKTTAGQTLTAALNSNVQLQKGDFVELVINNITAENVFAELKTKEQTPQKSEAKLDEMLSKLDIPVNDKNIEAAKLILKHNLPINKETISKAVNFQKSAESLKQGSPESKLGLILSDINIKHEEINVLNKTALVTESEVKALVKNFERSDVKLPAAEEPIVLKDVIQHLKKALVLENKEIEVSRTAKQGVTHEQIEEQINKILDKLDIPINDKMSSFIASTAKSLAVTGSSKLEEIVFLLSKDIDITPTNLELLKNNITNENKLDDFFKKLQNQIENKESQIDNPQGAIQLKDIKEDIKKVFIEPKMVENKEEVNEKLKEIIKLGEKLETVLNKENISDPEIKSTLTNLRDNIDFIRQINQFNNYLQIPIMINGQSNTADIYVFRDKKRSKSIDPQNATILVALDLKNLGHLESLITVTKKNVDVTFRVEHPKSGEMLKKQTRKLADALAAKGFALNPIKIIKLEQAFNLITLNEIINEGNTDNLHFDARV